MKFQLAALAGLALFLAGCTLSMSPPTSGLHIRMGNSVARNLTNMATWDLVGTSDSDSVSSLGNALGEDVLISGLAPGDWTFTATGYDSSGASILTGSAQTTLVAGEDGEVTLTLGAAHSLNIVLSFPGSELPSVASSEAPDHVLQIRIDQAGNLTAPTGYDVYSWFEDGIYKSAQTTNVFGWGLYHFSAGTRPRILLVATRDGKSDSEEVVLEVGGC